MISTNQLNLIQNQIRIASKPTVEECGLGDDATRDGERELMAALLSDGIEAYIQAHLRRHKIARRERSEAASWVETQNDSYVFSFDNVCGYLGLDANYLRAGLRNYAASLAVVRGDAIGVEKLDRPRSNHTWKKVRRPRR